MFHVRPVQHLTLVTDARSTLMDARLRDSELSANFARKKILDTPMYDLNSDVDH